MCMSLRFCFIVVVDVWSGSVLMLIVSHCCGISFVSVFEVALGLF